MFLVFGCFRAQGFPKRGAEGPQNCVEPSPGNSRVLLMDGIRKTLGIPVWLLPT